MKLMNKKTLLASAIIAVTTGCGSDDYDRNADKGPNTAPVAGGDIVLNFHEKNAFFTQYLLNGAYDPDGDVLYVQNLSADTEDLTGFEVNEARIGIRPTDLALELDNDETRTVTFSYTISDGQASVDRKLTVTVEGEDFAPEFDDLFVLIDDKNPTTEVDLVAEVNDPDNEPLLVSNFVASPDLDASLYTLDAENAMLTLETQAILDTLTPGDVAIFRDNNYNVEDHNHSLPRMATIVVAKTSEEPAPPVVLGPAMTEVSTNGALKMVNLASPGAVLEPNGDAIEIDWSSLAPVDGGPALHFNRSEGTMLAVDGIDFGAFVAEGESKTFTYSYDLSDGTADHTVTNTVEITVMGEAITQVLPNGSFENDLEGWNATDGVMAATASALGLNVDGSAFASMLAGDELSPALPGNALEEGAGYIIEARGAHGNSWGAYPMWVTGDIGEEVGQIINSQAWFAHGANPRTFATRFEGAANTKVTITAPVEVGAAEYDAVMLYKYSTDPGNNLISQDNATFENGAGDWTVQEGGSISANGPISGNASLNTGELQDRSSTLPLAAGTIKNGSRYLLTYDLVADGLPAAGTKKIRASIIDPVTGETVQGAPFKGVFEVRQNMNHMAMIFDPDLYTGVTDWESRELQLQLGVNVWAGGMNFRIDNVRLIELP
ncbi:Ig-like domain-containing protein [Gilvimarinus agarilyticus]|uniref:Ig-like domain-containing protein n=1 Tax=Gilvimarinus agarilyticus TaxID=679259 RepID=UPI00059F2AE4|nr:Ig-like domain-containing protein [Gilvimarinus agarilyticus]